MQSSEVVCPSLLSLFKNVLLLNGTHETGPKKSVTPDEPMLLHASLVFQKKFTISVNLNSLSRFSVTESKEFKFLFQTQSLAHPFSVGDLIKNIVTANWNINFCRNKFHTRIFNLVEIKFTIMTPIILALCGTE